MYVCNNGSGTGWHTGSAGQWPPYAVNCQRRSHTSQLALTVYGSMYATYAYAESMTSYQKSDSVSLCLLCIYLKNNLAKFHPDPIWNDEALGLLEQHPPSKNNMKHKISSTESSNMGSWSNKKINTDGSEYLNILSSCKLTDRKFQNFSLIVVNTVAKNMLSAIVGWWLNIETNNGRRPVAKTHFAWCIGKSCTPWHTASNASSTLAVSRSLWSIFLLTHCAALPYWPTVAQRQNIYSSSTK